ncbi:trypsin-like peptidase domain-containing protein [Staphylococcus pseudoxylosus]|uniref:trypsin-like serine peptidase n=1 Tax=Staphylococcus pseudoxylosus TaxID=2282419 RepID=UPI002DBF117C|nr:trypsin-like peptidase domain-containing protein [Staphylococcus pseudoxylosus]MEB8086542.1 trypsin-like peptidase domain-containing protein [Staphylococcus pseudoxylosus]
MRNLIRRLLLIISILLLISYVLKEKSVDASSLNNDNTYITEPTKPIKDATPVEYEIPQENLRPIEEATGSDIERILGKDDRILVENYTSYPYKTIVLLNMTFTNITYIGTGTVIAPDTILTAAHNVYDSRLGGWATEITAYAGARANKATIGKAKVDKKYVLPEWINSQSSQHDLAVIKLKTSLGDQTGTLGITNEMKLSEPIETAGYPADKGGWTLYKGNGLLKKITNFNVYYDIDTYGGQSGSPVWNRDKKIIGVHAYGSSPLNFATKINDTNLKLIKKWTNIPVGHVYNKDVTVSKSNISVWNDFQFHIKKPLTHIKLGNVYKAKYIYKHNNGQTYLSLYDNKNKWIGYFNKRDVSDLKGTLLNKKVKINKSNYVIWDSFYFDNKKSLSKNFYDKTLNAKYSYVLGNNEEFYSLYDSKNKWVGYINKKATQ